MATGGQSSSRSDTFELSGYSESGRLYDATAWLGDRKFPDFDEHTVYHPYHDPMAAAYEPDALLYDDLMAETNIENLKAWIKVVYGKICGYDYFKDELALFLYHRAPELQIEESDNPVMIMTALVRYFDELKEKYQALNVSFDKLNELEVSELRERADYFTMKILNGMKRNNALVEAMKEKVSKATITNNLLTEENSALKTEICMLKGAHLIDDSVAENFLDEMEAELMQKDELHSTLLGEVERERILVDRLQSELADYQREVAAIHKENLDEINRYIKDIEVEGGIRRAIVNKIQRYKADPKKIQKIVDDWMIAIRGVMAEKQEEIDKIKEMHIALDDELASKKIMIEELQDDHTGLNVKIEKYETLLETMFEDNERIAMEYEDLKQTVEGVQDETEQLREQLAELDQEYITLSREVERKQREINEQQQALESSGRSPSGSSRSAGSPDLTDRISSRSPTGSVQSPEFHSGIDSSGHFRSFPSPGFTDRSSSRSPPPPPGSPYSPLRTVTPPPGFYDSSPESISTPRAVPYSPTSLAPGSPYIPLITITPPSGFYDSSPESISSPSLPGRIATVAPGTQTISRPQIIINPSTQTTTGVRNRFDIGQGMNMHTVTRGSPKPYHQVTKVDSKLPVPGTSRMADSSFSLKHTAELTPSQFVTPFISKTRFGYTDPTAKVLNLPPGKDLDIGTSLKKTLLLTSPLREQPLLVNIDVDPKPLIRSASGEHFVCDISLDVQPSQEQQPVFSYGVPPAITPSTTRRHGLLHTPRGIFKKKHFNVRKLFEPGYISPEMPSSYFPDSSSPLTGDFPPSPEWLDQTIPWEEGSEFGPPIMDRTFDAPCPSVMNRTFDAPGPSVMNRTFDRSRSPGLGRSLSPVLGRTFDRSSSPVLGRTFDRSPSPVLDRTYDMSPSPVLGRTFDRSPSPVLDRTYDRSPSPVLGRSPSPVLGRTFDRSPSPVIKRPVYAGQLPYSSSGMSSTSPVIKRKIETSSPGGAYARSPSPVIKGKVYTYGVPPAITATTSRRHGPFTPRGIFKKDHYNVRRLFGPDYISPEMPHSYFHDSISPLTGDFPPSPPYWGDQTIPWERSSDQDTLDENLMDLTSDESPSPRYGRQYPAQSRASPSPIIKGPYYRHQSPASGGSLDRSASPVIQRPFHQSPLPGPSRMHDRSPSPIIKRPYYAIPSSDSSSGRSASPMINRTFGSSPGYDSSLSSSASPRLDPQQLNATFDRSTSPQLNRTSNRSESPQMNLTFDTSPPNPMDRTSDSTASSQSATSSTT